MFKLSKEQKVKCLRYVLGRYLAERVYIRKKLGYWANLKEPKTFNEKVLKRKLYDDNPIFTQLADKIKVRDFVEERIGRDYLPLLYFTGSNPKEIPFDRLPDEYVVKSNHESGRVYIQDGKKSVDKALIVKGMAQSLQTKYGDITNEGFYLKIQPKVMVEEYLKSPQHDSIPDYKFFCFHGVCHFIQVDVARGDGNHRRNFYDRSWASQPFEKNTKKGAEIARPDTLDEMLTVAEKLSQGFEFVRVDLYSLASSVKFGEMTFTPGAGYSPFSPPSYDRVFGDLW